MYFGLLSFKVVLILGIATKLLSNIFVLQSFGLMSILNSHFCCLPALQSSSSALFYNTALFINVY